MEKRKSEKLVTRVLGMLLVIAMSVNLYSCADEKNEAQAQLEAGKAEIEKELDQMIVKYDAEIAENTNMKSQLKSERTKLVSYRDSLKAEKKATYSTIKRYQNRVNTLQKKNEELFEEVEVLSTTNKKLTKEVKTANAVIEAQEAVSAELVAENESLSTMVAVASELGVGPLTIESMKRKSSGELKATSRAKYTDAFRVSFNIEENQLSPSGDIVSYVIIADSEGTVLSPKGKIANLPEPVYYSGVSRVNYKNIETNVEVVTDVDRDEIEKGEYSVVVFIDGSIVGESAITVK